MFVSDKMKGGNQLRVKKEEDVVSLRREEKL